MNETLTKRESRGMNEPAYYQKMPRSSALVKDKGHSAPRQSALVPRASFLGVPRDSLQPGTPFNEGLPSTRDSL